MSMAAFESLEFCFYVLIGIFLVTEITIWILKKKEIVIPKVLLFLQSKKILPLLISMALVIMALEPYFLERKSVYSIKSGLVQRVRCHVRSNLYANTIEGDLCFQYGLKTFRIHKSQVVPDLHIREKTTAEIMVYDSYIWGKEAYFKVLKIGREI